MNTRGCVLHNGILGLGQKTTPGPCRSLASTSTTDFASWGGLLLIVLMLGVVGSGGVHGGQPLGVLRVAAVDDVEERVLHLLRDGPAAAGADLHAVELADRRHF